MQDKPVVDPNVDDQVPGKQEKHWEATEAPVSEVQVPALHKLHESAPDADHEPASQATHCADDESPENEEYVPAVHGKH